MLRSARALLLFIALLGLAAGSAAADEEKGAKEIWVYEKDGEKREIHVTHMSPELREAVNTQLEAKGWKRVAVDLELKEEQLPEEGEPEKDPKKLDESTKRDIEELVKGGGKLPEGFQPHALGEKEAPAPATSAALAGMVRAAGRVMLRYLEVKDDPAKGPVYEKVLGDVGRLLVGLDDAQGFDPRVVGMRMLGTFMRGMNDPKTASVYREIVEMVSKEMAASMTRGPPPPKPPAVRGHVAPHYVGGAALRVKPGTPSDPFVPVLRVLGVEPGSIADEMGLRTGDVIRSVNGEKAPTAALETIRGALGKPGKLSIEVKRRDGKIEVLDIEFEAEEPAGGSGSK